MKKVLALLFFSLVVNFSYADCAMSGMDFFPKKRNISLNSLFIIQGYSMSEETVESFRKREIFLISESGEMVLLTLQEILKGQMSLTQGIFKPVRELKPNTKYFLKYSNETKREIVEMQQWNAESKQREKVYWQTSEVKSTDLISSSLKIDYEKSEVIHYGCGPSSNAIFTVSNSNDLEVWYKTEVIEIATNKKTTFYLTEWENKLNVGHGMCAGGFIFKDVGKYKVRFTPVNTDGESIKTTEWKLFDSPFENDKPFIKLKLPQIAV
jgi:hypothetical protein